jgi:hypothetical protein
MNNIPVTFEFDHSNFIVQKCFSEETISMWKKAARDDWELNYDRYATKTRDNQPIIPMEMNIQLKRLLRDYKQQKIEFAIKELHSASVYQREGKKLGHKLYVGCIQRSFN